MVWYGYVWVMCTRDGEEGREEKKRIMQTTGGSDEVLRFNRERRVLCTSVVSVLTRGREYCILVYRLS